MKALILTVRHLHRRELGFLGLIALTGLLIGLQLASGLGHVGISGGGWRTIDRAALERRIESGVLSEREAEWFRSVLDQGAGEGARAPEGGP
jgi:hypothetical protein